MQSLQAYKIIKQQLQEAGVEDAGFEAQQLFAHAAGAGRFELAALTPTQWDKLKALVHRRCKHEPLQYILGSWSFLELELFVGQGVLIPRPETEEVCLAALNTVATLQTPDILDLCSGSGALALGLQSRIPLANVVAVEKEDAALSYLVRNIEAYSGKNKPLAVQADALTYAQGLAPYSLDLIVCNPPYVTAEEYTQLAPEVLQEPRSALVADEEGLLFYNVIAPAYHTCLRTGAHLVFEIGAQQGEAVVHIMQNSGYKGVQCIKDIFGNSRIVMGSA